MDTLKLLHLFKKIDRYEIIDYTDNENRGLVLEILFIGVDNVFPDHFKNHRVNNAVLGLGELKSSELRRSIRKWLRISVFLFNLLFHMMQL